MSAADGRFVVAQFSDTHVVRDGTTYFGRDTAAYLADAIDALGALERAPDCVVISGDLVNDGVAEEYARFAAVVRRIGVPYYVVPGNHDDRDRMRAALPPRAFGGAWGGRVRFAIDDFAVRLIALDANVPRPWPGAALDSATLDWLAGTLAADPGRPAIVCVHQPPFRTGLHYLDAFGFVGAGRLRALARRYPNLELIVSGHIHCVRARRWEHALLCSAPSTAPQAIPLLLMDGRVAGVRRETPGFLVHEWRPGRGVRTHVYRRTASARYEAERLPGT